MAQVSLNVYDLDSTVQAINVAMSPFGLGAYHTGVEVHGREYVYSQSGPRALSGISTHAPKRHDVHVFRQTLLLGHTKLAPEEVVQIIEQMARAWTAGKYELLNHNCCHFCDEFCQRLGVGCIPKWVYSLPEALSALQSSWGTAAKLVGQLLPVLPASLPASMPASLPNSMGSVAPSHSQSIHPGLQALRSARSDFTARSGISSLSGFSQVPSISASYSARPDFYEPRFGSPGTPRGRRTGRSAIDGSFRCDSFHTNLPHAGSFSNSLMRNESFSSQGFPVPRLDSFQSFHPAGPVTFRPDGTVRPDLLCAD